MARDFAQIRLDIWADDDWRDLSCCAQWLYLHLLSSPALNFAGVTDWRPARIAAVTADLRAADVEMFAVELERGDFVVIDRETEECLIRSWLKHDGLLSNSNMCKAFVKAHAAIGSSVLRAVIVDQLRRLKVKRPDLQWQAVAPVMGRRSLTVDEARSILSPNPSATPSGTPSTTPFGTPSGTGSATPSGTHPLTPYSVLRSPVSPLPPSSHPSRSDRHQGAAPVPTDVVCDLHEEPSDGCAVCWALARATPATAKESA